MSQAAKELVEVEATFRANGEIAPRAFVWRGRRYDALEVGRSWRDEDGGPVYRVLVRTPTGDRFQLSLRGATLQWAVEACWPGSSLA